MRPKKVGSTTTEQPYVTFETTQIYLPDDFTTADFEYVEHTVDESMSAETDDRANPRQTRYTDFNPYAWNSGDGDDVHVPLGSAGTAGGHRTTNLKWERRKLRKNSGRRRMDRHNQNHKQMQKREIRDANTDDIYYIQSANIVSQLHDDLSLMQHINRTYNSALIHTDSLQPTNNVDDHFIAANNVGGINHSTATSNLIGGGGGTGKKSKKMKATKITLKLKNGKLISKIALQRTQSTDNRQRSVKDLLIGNDNNNDDAIIEAAKQDVGGGGVDDEKNTTTKNALDTNNSSRNSDDNADDTDAQRTQNGTATLNDDNTAAITHNETSSQLHRVKRKSGKAAGALSRPKGGSDSSSKSTSRKKDGKWLGCAMLVNVLSNGFWPGTTTKRQRRRTTNIRSIPFSSSLSRSSLLFCRTTHERRESGRVNERFDVH